MEVDIVKDWHIVKDHKVYVLKHNVPCIDILNGIDGVFDDIVIANKAKKICQEDKPNWVFSVEEHSLITDIYK